MSSLPIISLSKGVHRKEKQIFIGFKHDWALINVVKHIPNVNWIATLKSWYVKNNPENLSQIMWVFKDKANVDTSQIFKPETSEQQKLDDKVEGEMKKFLEKFQVILSFIKFYKLFNNLKKKDN